MPRYPKIEDLPKRYREQVQAEAEIKADLKETQRDIKRQKGTPKETEAQFQKRVIDYAHYHGWRILHIRPGRVSRGGEDTYRTPVSADGKGYPDLTLVCERGVRGFVWAELKVGRNKPTPEQQQWLDSLTANDAAAYLWYPEDWPEIEQVLAGAEG